MEFGERHDRRTNGQHYTAADRRPTNQVSAWQAANARHADTLARILARKLLSWNLSLCEHDTQLWLCVLSCSLQYTVMLQ